jgi:citrate lyase subunit beta/citryl-CoA lyase
MTRSYLFIPGDSERKMQRSTEFGSDALILDLEDSVSPERKPAARAIVLAFLKQARQGKARPRLFVRVNALDTGMTDADLDAIVAGRPDGIMLPKAQGGASVIHLDAKLAAREAIHGLTDGAIAILPIATETASALFLAGTYAGASARLCAMTWGAEDLAADLGAETNKDAGGNFLDPYRLARSLCVAGAAAAGVAAIDTVYVDFRDEAGLRRECEEARRDGFTGKMAIHPAQIAVINDVFTPKPEAIAHARAIVEAFAKNPDLGVVGIGGKMVDRPHLRIAERLLARAKAAGLA